MTVAIIVVLLSVGGWWYSSRSEMRLLQFPTPSAAVASSAFSYAAALANYVDAHGMVDYRALKFRSGDLDEFAASLSLVEPHVLDSWSDKQKIAFWVNAYNALTLEAILRNYPIEPSFIRSFFYPRNSIRQIPGVWDHLEFSVAGRQMTLNDIEHGTLRPRFNEPRIHVALVCAAISCPPLRSEPYAAEHLDQQLDDQARVFLHSPHGLRIDRTEGKVYLSSIFKWFGEDFVRRYPTSERFADRSATERAVLNFVSQYLGESDRDFLLGGAYKIEYLDYDWSLNERGAD